jgi:hypothetical protein
MIASAFVGGVQVFWPNALVMRAGRLAQPHPSLDVLGKILAWAPFAQDLKLIFSIRGDCKQ